MPLPEWDASTVSLVDEFRSGSVGPASGNLKNQTRKDHVTVRVCLTKVHATRDTRRDLVGPVLAYATSMPPP